MRKLLFKTSSQNGHECLKFKPNTLENYFVIFFFGDGKIEGIY